ncbi:MAG: multifunctional 5-methylthioadenosine / S-adenosylhomocysteine nucleosidase [Pseudomonadota bacterium]|jgi:adenosylhomocysteine/aminodeoxyfutalosine nucleosidase
MRLAIMGAMREEIEPLLEVFNVVATHEIAKNVFYEAKYKHHEIVLAYSKIGKVNAAVTATILLEKYKCEALLFSGVAGAIDKSLKIGDLVIADRVVQHDVDITAFGHPFGFIPESGDFYQADENLNEVAKEAAKKIGKNLLVGTIATGDQFVACEKKNSWIGDTFKAHALEMEGASVGYVCSCYGKPFFILRAISDGADMDAGFNFDTFLASSAKESANLLVAMLDLL